MSSEAAHGDKAGRLAQLGEHRPYKARVTGSSPVPPTNPFGQLYLNFELGG